EGHSLKQFIAGQQPSPRQAATLMKDLAHAVDYAHSRGIIHRDLKPANVLMDARDQPRITDFGLSKSQHCETQMTATGQLLGTPAYMSPEQALGQNQRVTPATDVYSLGAMLYELLTRRVPFESESVVGLLDQIANETAARPSSLRADLDRDLEVICLKCLEKDPDLRYVSARLLAEDLERYLRGEPIRATPISKFSRGYRWCRRHPVVAGLSLSLGLCLTLFAITTTYLSLTSRQQEIVATSRRRQSDESLEMVLGAANVMVDQSELLADVPDQGGKRLNLLTRAKQILDRSLVQRPNDQQLQFESANLSRLIGDVHGAEGNQIAAEEAFQRAANRTNELLSQRPDSLRYALAQSENYISMARLLRRHDSDRAIDYMNRSMEIHDRLSRENHLTVEVDFARARAVYHRGIVHSERGEWNAAERDCLAATKLLEKLIQGHSFTNHSQSRLDAYSLDLGRVLNVHGVVMTNTNRSPDAIPLIRRAINLHQTTASGGARFSSRRQTELSVFR
ncbi:MAG: serine/threonine-protein kinase, partial [Planctomycetota bacterium]